MLLSPELSDLSRQLLKDPYNFDFLSLTDATQERDLERALLERIKEFLLELGIGFAFVGSQYRLDVEGDEYFLDLLFYHLKLHCYVVIDSLSWVTRTETKVFTTICSESIKVSSIRSH